MVKGLAHVLQTVLCCCCSSGVFGAPTSLLVGPFSSSLRWNHTSCTPLMDYVSLIVGCGDHCFTVPSSWEENRQENLP